MSDVSNVSAAKPAIGGSLSVAPLGTDLPTTADEALDAAFTTLGYISDAGLTNSNGASVTAHKAWGGDIVLVTQDEKPDNFKFSLIEVLDVDVLKFIYGDDNVSGTLATGITVKANNAEPETRSLVFDMIMRDGNLQRIVIENGQITEMEDIVYVDNDLVGFDVTVAAYPDSDNDTHKAYILEAPSA